MVRFPDGREVRGPLDVVRERVRVGVVGRAVQRQPLERDVDGDAQRADGEVHPVVREGVGRAYGVQPVAGAQGRVRVDHTRVGVDAESHHEQCSAPVVEDMEDGAVIGISVARRDVLHRQRHLMDGVFVERDGTVVGHGILLLTEKMTVRQKRHGRPDPGAGSDRTPDGRWREPALTARTDARRRAAVTVRRRPALTGHDRSALRDRDRTAPAPPPAPEESLPQSTEAPIYQALVRQWGRAGRTLPGRRDQEWALLTATTGRPGRFSATPDPRGGGR